MYRKLYITLVVAITAFAAACSILKKDDPEKEVRVFLSSFEKSLSLSDGDILKQFESKQSAQSILAAIALLQNKDMKYIQCQPEFSKAAVFIDENGTRASIPVSMTSKGVESTYTRETSLTLWLKPKTKTFAIVQLEAEELYNAYVSLKNEMEWQVNRKEEMLARGPILATAKQLQQTYDSVVWFAHHNERTYFYVVNGTWDVSPLESADVESSADYKMGLVDVDGNIIIPVEFELIGTLGMLGGDLVEVWKDGQTGLYDLQGTQQLAPDFKMLIPYESEEVMMLAHDGAAYGWIDWEKQFETGFPSPDAEAHIMGYHFIPEEFRFSASDQSLCQVPNEEYFGYGVAIPPSYWTATGIFRPVITGIVIDGFAMHAYVEYVETQKTFFENVTDNVSAVITTIRERYLEGREEFYSRHQLVLVNPDQDTLAVADNLHGTGNFEIRRIGNLLEVKCEVEDDSYYYVEMPEEQDFGIPFYAYYELQEDLSVVPLENERRYGFTQFVKIDSSYVMGSFQYYNPETESVEPSTFLSNVTLQDMRNEILAYNGFIFKDESLNSEYSGWGWYVPRYESYSELLDQMNEIDRHNLAFLEKILGPFQQGVSI